MIKRLISFAPTLIGSLVLVFALAAVPAIALDNDAELVNLRKLCSEDGTPVPNCFTTTASLTDWIFNTRNPTEAAPLTVRVGPGQFDPFQCGTNPWSNFCSCSAGEGWVSVVGSGREQTKFYQPEMQFAAAIKVQACENMNFQDLTAQGQMIGVYWYAGGSATWTNVDVIAGPFTGSPTLAWYDQGGSAHYAFNTRVWALGAGDGGINVGWNATGSEVWFYGGEILATSELDPTSIFESSAVFVSTGGDFRIFGSTVRSSSGAATSASFSEPPLGVDVLSGDFHMHGGIVNVDSSSAATGTGATAVVSRSPGNTVHVLDTAFALKTATGGVPKRIDDPHGSTKTAFQWQSGPFPPGSGNETSVLESAQGQDLYVETDCAQSGDCSGAGSEPHLMIYSASCTTNGPWFNVVTGACRGVTP